MAVWINNWVCLLFCHNQIWKNPHLRWYECFARIEKNSPVCTDLPIAKNSFFWDLQKTILPRPLPWLNASDRQKHLRNPDFGHIVMKIMKQSLCTCHCKLETDKCLEIKSTLIHLGYSSIQNLLFRIMYVQWIAKKCLF